MQVITVDLQNHFSYFPVILLILFGLAGTLLILFLPLIKFKKKSHVPVVKPAPPQSIATLKNKYLKVLADIEQNRQADKITDRQAFQALSRVVRDFVYKATGIKVQNYTLMEIHAANIPPLYELISQCYIPEFAMDTQSDVFLLINKARKVIAEWN